MKQDHRILFYVFLGLAVLLLLTGTGLVLGNNHQIAGWSFVGALVSLAFACKFHISFKGYSYTTLIFAAVCLAMYHPEYFIRYKGFYYTGLITPFIQLIMFGMGTTMSVKDFAAVGKTPKLVGIGVLCQVTIMPLLGFMLASVSKLPTEIAAGIILIGCSPSGMASNVIAYLANANLALSITITTMSTLIAPVSTPLLMKFLAGTFIAIDPMAMMWDIVKMVILPIGGGLIVNKLIKGKLWLTSIMPLLSMVGIICIIVVITASGQESLKQIGLWLVCLVFMHNTLGYGLGYGVGKLLKLEERDCRTLAIETGMQNGGLASGIAKEMGKIATVGLAPAVFGPLMNVTGSLLASFWKKRPLDKKCSMN
ncbi:bile acid:sodium symporter family protein [Olivibacter sp. SDN3]|uniref:bile acid:sodium symporter family protein n=1 Tax=Olivibacter sp. SDN3 TaxID=2764720 RepID=UPI0016519B09|nr:bile acid:sodium symporter family protein [Olivibacter sp. SDN3]QNL50755.1 bile acid:sodium symporter family protein [Olivibacter sp. SDN3]